MRRLILSFLATITMAIQVTAAGDDALYRYHYIEAVRQQDMGHYGTAFALFNRCKAMRPDASETYFALGRLYLLANQDSIGLVFTQKAVELEPENTEYAERLAGIYLYKNEIDSATAVYERLTALQPDRTEYLSLLLRIYNQQHEYSKMLSTLERLELQEGQSEDITLSKMQVYSYLDNQQGAYNELRKLVDAHPYDLSLQVMMGNWLFSNSRKEEALATFKKVLAEEPDNATGQMSLMDYYRAEGQNDAADTLLYRMLVNPRTEPSTRVAMMRTWVKDSEERGGDSIRVMQMFDRVLQLPQKTSEVAEMRVAYMMLKNAPADSLRSGWERILQITPEDVSARLRLITIMWEDSIDENVIRECKKAVEYVPDEPALYYYLGVAQYLNEHYDDAIATLRRGADNITKETSGKMAADIFSVLGDILHKQQRVSEAYAAYDSCLIHNPDNVQCLNNYAYFLSLDAKDLKKAEKMSYRAITAEPGNGTYLDTYAWILYKQGRYEEARIYIEQALLYEEQRLNGIDSTVSEIADSIASDTIAANEIHVDTAATGHIQIAGDILEHAGDIYIKLNRREDALQMWRRALESGVEDERKLTKKIRKTKP